VGKSLLGKPENNLLILQLMLLMVPLCSLSLHVADSQREREGWLNGWPNGCGG
jgi:hypothetical protein